jgi:hypothetical protein
MFVRFRVAVTYRKTGTGDTRVDTRRQLIGVEEDGDGEIAGGSETGIRRVKSDAASCGR